MLLRRRGWDDISGDDPLTIPTNRLDQARRRRLALRRRPTRYPRMPAGQHEGPPCMADRPRRMRGGPCSRRGDGFPHGVIAGGCSPLDNELDHRLEPRRTAVTQYVGLNVGRGDALDLGQDPPTPDHRTVLVDHADRRSFQAWAQGLIIEGGDQHQRVVYVLFNALLVRGDPDETALVERAHVLGGQLRRARCAA
jgi:hypothetical protein